MKISIITPTRNVASTVKYTILSVLNQRFHDYEHIIIDACSNDGTLEVLNKYKHLKLISEADQGIYDAMNKGVTMASGEWIYFLGADDTLISDDILEKVSAELVSPLKVVYGDVRSDRFDDSFGGEFDYQKLLHRNICHQAMFIHRDVFEVIGNFNLKYNGQSDWDHNIRWFFNDKIESKYVGLVIANYADGGFSSVMGDPVFQKDLPFNFVKNGYAVLPFFESFELLAKAVKRSIKSAEIKQLFECLLIGLKILTGKIAAPPKR